MASVTNIDAHILSGMLGRHFQLLPKTKCHLINLKTWNLHILLRHLELYLNTDIHEPKENLKLETAITFVPGKLADTCIITIHKDQKYHLS